MRRHVRLAANRPVDPLSDRQPCGLLLLPGATIYDVILRHRHARARRRDYDAPGPASLENCDIVGGGGGRLTVSAHSGNYLPLPQGGEHPLKLFKHPKHSPPLEVLRVLTRTLIGSMLFSAI